MPPEFRNGIKAGQVLATFKRIFFLEPKYSGPVRFFIDEFPCQAEIMGRPKADQEQANTILEYKKSDKNFHKPGVRKKFGEPCA
jgi:hypothetical protein